MAHKRAGWLHNLGRLGVPNTKAEVIHKYAKWVHNP